MGLTKLIEDQPGADARIDRYDLIAEIASGGMATVYLGRLSGVGGFQRSFAIKRLHPHLATNVDFVQMFLDEARLAAMIRHPNVVPILEVGHTPTLSGAIAFYLVMEYIEGDTLASLLSKTSARGQRIPNAISLRIAVDMLHGLHAAHELTDEHGRSVGLVHRDVSPQNVLVGTDGITRITDFGVARAASALNETRAGQLKGKLAYMAPEQASGVDEVDRRADVFSSGVVLWEALAFRRLFKANHEATTLSRVLNELIPSPDTYNPAVPEAIAQVCMKALQRPLAQRYESCAEFAAELEQAAGAELASSKQVADYVKEIVGREVEARRAALRQWMERKEQQGSSPDARISLPPELSSVTLASEGPPPAPASHTRLTAVADATRSSALPPQPSSLTHSGVIQTAVAGEASPRNKSVLVLAGSVAVLAVAGLAYFAWPQSAADEPLTEASTTTAALQVPPSASAVLTAPASQTAQPKLSEGKASAEQEDGPAKQEEDGPAKQEGDPEQQDSRAEQEAAETTDGPRRPSSRRRSTRGRARPAKKAKELPNLENPYK